MIFRITWNPVRLVALLLLALIASACDAGNNETPAAVPTLTLPQLQPVPLAGRKLRVVATTSIVGDVVGQVGGDAIALTTLIGPGQDPHSYEPAPGALAAGASADVIFVHGWNLEEGLLDNLTGVAADTPLVPVAAQITPLTRQEDAGAADPHTWLDPHLALQWVENIERALAALDPGNATIYARNAAAYRAELQTLLTYVQEQIARIPPAQRKLVTSHDALAYFARAYNFDVVGTVIPGASTLAEPSASTLAQLAETMDRAGVCTIFTETTANEEVARALAAELEHCDTVETVPLFTGTLSAPGGGAASYTAMMRANVDAIVRALSE